MFDVQYSRRQFPAFKHRPDAVFFDGPAGTQVPQRVIDAMVHYFTHCNANHGGVFATSRESDELLHRAHEAVADFLNAPAADEVIFGSNMTTLTMQFTRSVGKTLKPGDEIVVTRLDHDANVSPWVLAVRDAGATVRWIEVNAPECTLDLDGFKKQLNARTRWVAVGCASNAAGTINDVASITRLAHDAGALVFLDAVHYTPHGVTDIAAWGCDALGCSAYKFFGPHIGILWARKKLWDDLPVYKLRPSSNALPERWMTGTQNHECIVGVAAAVDYLHDVGVHAGHVGDRRSTLRAAMTAIRAYEAELGKHLLEGLAAQKRFQIWGITDPQRLAWRVPTISFSSNSIPADKLATRLAERDIFSWNGNMYAINLSEQLGLEGKGGFLRLGLLHYNTHEEIDRALGVLVDTR